MQHEKRPALGATSVPGAVTSRNSERKISTKPIQIPLDDVLIDGHTWPLLPEGEYLVAYTHHETALVFRTPKVFVHFRIVEPGPYFDTRLFRAYRTAESIGQLGKNGRFKLKPRSELYLTMCWLYQAQKIRPDRVSLRDLKQLRLRATVRTVNKDYKQRPLPENLHYSVLDEIKGIEVEEPDNLIPLSNY